ncbi:hypothetical protein ACIQZD_12285 [Peribacillus sp. NPDC096447]|uniref:hypothetical protein n=1 Tax=Peribacillus sp. NPDC096447 TaxID=3364394 RepID=UPI00380C958D
MRFIHLLVNLKHLLVSWNVTQDFELFSYEIGANIQEIGRSLVNSCHLLVNFMPILENSNVTQDFELFRHEIRGNIQEIERLLVNSEEILVKFIHLLVSLEQILVKFIHLLVKLEQILVNSNVTQDFEQFQHEIWSEYPRDWAFTREYTVLEDFN